MHFTETDINSLNHLYKIRLINSISGFKPANLIATKSVEGITNVAIFSSVVHYGSSPAILGFTMRPTTVVRNTYKNIKETKFYSINAISVSMLEDAHHTSAKYPEEISEFDKTNLSEEFKPDFLAPFVKQSPLQIGMEFLEEYKIKANDTILILGKVKHLFFDKKILSKDGFINLSQEKIVAINGLDGYVETNALKRFDYQRPK